MNIKIKMDANGNKKIHVSGLETRGFSRQTNQPDSWELHRLTIGTHKESDLTKEQAAELEELVKAHKPSRKAFIVQGNYGYGWEDLTEEETRKAGREMLKIYSENYPSPHRLIVRRVKD